MSVVGSVSEVPCPIYKDRRNRGDTFYVLVNPAPIGTEGSAMNQFTQQPFDSDYHQYSEEHGAQSVSVDSGQSNPAKLVAAYQLRREDQDFLRSLDDGFILANDDSSFALPSDRTPLPSAAIGSLNPVGSLQANRQAPNVPDPEQGVASVQSSTGPTVTLPEAPSFVTSSYMPPPTVIDSAVISHSCAQAIPYGYAMSVAVTVPWNQNNCPGQLQAHLMRGASYTRRMTRMLRARSSRGRTPHCIERNPYLPILLHDVTMCTRLSGRGR